MNVAGVERRATSRRFGTIHEHDKASLELFEVHELRIALSVDATRRQQLIGFELHSQQWHARAVLVHDIFRLVMIVVMVHDGHVACEQTEYKIGLGFAQRVEHTVDLQFEIDRKRLAFGQCEHLAYAGLSFERIGRCGRVARTAKAVRRGRVHIYGRAYGRRCVRHRCASQKRAQNEIFFRILNQYRGVALRRVLLVVELEPPVQIVFDRKLTELMMHRKPGNITKF